MDKLLFPGRMMYAISMAVSGALCIQYRDFLVGRPPAWTTGIQVNPLLGFTSGAILIVASLAILLRMKPALAALVIAVLILLLSVSRHLPQFMTDWINAYKALAMIGGALIIAGSFSIHGSRTADKFTPNERLGTLLSLMGCFLLSAFFLACGYAHFKWAEAIQYFIPAYIPLRLFWTYFTGVCLIAGGVGLVIRQTRKWAALMSGIMVFGWFLLLHIPLAINSPYDYNARLGLSESFAFSGIFFVLAASLGRRSSEERAKDADKPGEA